MAPFGKCRLPAFLGGKQFQTVLFHNAGFLRLIHARDVDLGSDASLGSFAGADAIISPDGTRLV